MEFFNRYPLITNTGFFFLLLFGVGFAARALLRRLAKALDASVPLNDRPSRDQRPPVSLALADLAAWLFAFIVASECGGLRWLAAVTGMLFGWLPTTCAILAAALVIAYAFSDEARELLLSLWGGCYLRRYLKQHPDQSEFDLGGGFHGRVRAIELLHTEFVGVDGRMQRYSNAFVMRQTFGVQHGPAPSAYRGPAEKSPSVEPAPPIKVTVKGPARTEGIS